MKHTPSAFWDDLAEDLKDPDFLRDYILEAMRIQTVDHLVNSLDEAREAAGMTKADIARAVRAKDSVIRRLFSESSRNYTVETLSAVAAALGMRLTLEPLPEAERAYITEPLLSGSAANTHALAQHLTEVRDSDREEPALV
jgi:DNA-binding phage protein